MMLRMICFIAALGLMALSGASLAIAAAAALLFDALVWPSHNPFRLDPTPRSIFETRRAGLA